jgi:VIT1/CCC1 family predicted Fe2+/Mn2+ transporter
MKSLSLILDPRHRLDVVAGLIDGILNALILAAGKLYLHGGGASSALAFKVGGATAFTTLFVFFVAHYAELRAELVHAERELNLLSHGKLATTQLGRQVFSEAIVAALIASLCGLVGSIFPLLLSVVLPGSPVSSLFLTILFLGGLGALLAKSFFGSPLLWAMTMMGGGIALAFIGVKLNIAG